MRYLIWSLILILQTVCDIIIHNIMGCLCQGDWKKYPYQSLRGSLPSKGSLEKIVPDIT